jgi:transketolase
MNKQIATREAYGLALAEFGEKYDIVVLDADLSKSTKTSVFRDKYPDRFFSTGIAEGNMISTAAGLASCEKIVFASSFAMFAAGRAFEQIRNSVAYPNLNVKIGATHAGITVGEDGATHQALEDIGIMRTIPNMVIISPADAIEARQAVEAAILHKGPVYLRFGRLPVPVVNQENYSFELGKGVVLGEGHDVTIIANGMMVSEALKAKEVLETDGISTRVINIHTIKPIDKDLIINAAKETKGIITAEEHNIIGGLGSSVAEVLSENCPALLRRIGVRDLFGKSGKPEDLVRDYGLTSNEIVTEAKALLQSIV